MSSSPDIVEQLSIEFSEKLDEVQDLFSRNVGSQYRVTFDKKVKEFIECQIASLPPLEEPEFPKLVIPQNLQDIIIDAKTDSDQTRKSEREWLIYSIKDLSPYHSAFSRWTRTKRWTIATLVSEHKHKFSLWNATLFHNLEHGGGQALIEHEKVKRTIVIDNLKQIVDQWRIEIEEMCLPCWMTQFYSHEH